MANRYEQPIASEFINTYVPIPFQEMMQAGQMKQQRYDQGAAAADAAIQRAEMIRAIAGSPDDTYRKQAIQTMHDIRDKYVGKDLSDSFVLRQMNNEINTGIDKDWLQKMQESRDMWDQTEKMKRELASKNLLNPELDKMRDPAMSWNSKESGTYNYTPRAFQDKASLFHDYYKNLEPDYDSIDDLNGYQVLRQGVSKDKVKSVSRQYGQELLSNPAVYDHIEAYKLAHPTTEMKDIDILQKIMDDYGAPFASQKTTVLGASLQPGGGNKGDAGAIDKEWFVAGAARPVSGENTDRKALRKVDEEHSANQALLSSTENELRKLEEAGVHKDDVRFKSALQQQEKLANDIAKYEESMAEVDDRTAEAMKQKVEDLKVNLAPAIGFALGTEDTESVMNYLDAHLNDRFGKASRKFGHAMGSMGDNAVANAAALIPGVTGMLINGIHRELNKFGIVSKKDTQNLLDAVDSAIEETGITANSSFMERAQVGWKVLNRFTGKYTAASKTGLGSKVKDALTDRSLMVQMRNFDKQINALEKERDDVRQAEKAAIFNYNVSDMMVKPLNYTSKQGRISIISQDGTEYDSQINDFYDAVKIRPSSFEMRDVSEGERLKTGTKKFNEEAQAIMTSYEPLPGMIIPTVDKDGNVRVLISYQTDGRNNTKPGVKTFEVKVKDEKTIEAFANDYFASGYTHSYLRLVNRKLHQDVETYANSKEGHDYPITVRTKDGGTETNYITGKRIGTEYVAIDPDTDDVLVEIAPNGTRREVRFNTKEEFENWLYAKQHFLLTGKN